MKMHLVGVGPGIGVKDIRAVFVFKNKACENGEASVRPPFNSNA